MKGEIDIVMGGSILNVTNEIKYLDMIIDDKITWISHITYVKNTVSKDVGILFKVKNYLNRKVFISLYHSYIYPYLIYCVKT